MRVRGPSASTVATVAHTMRWAMSMKAGAVVARSAMGPSLPEPRSGERSPQGPGEVAVGLDHHVGQPEEGGQLLEADPEGRRLPLHVDAGLAEAAPHEQLSGGAVRLEVDPGR